MKSITTTVYEFDELSGAAQSVALQNNRHTNVEHDWWDYQYEDASTIAEMLGFDVMEHKTSKNRDGTTRHYQTPGFSFSGFWSQGDGACISKGTWSFAKCALKNLQKYAPKDAELHRIARGLTALQKQNGYQLTASIRQRGHYYHERSMEFDLDFEKHPDRAISSESYNAFKELVASFCLWLYKQLQNEYEHLTSDEVVAESLRANAREFCECGADYVPC